MSDVIEVIERHTVVTEDDDMAVVETSSDSVIVAEGDSGPQGPPGPAGADGASEWGQLTGDLEDQTDLQTVLDTKIESVVPGDNISVDTTDPKNPVVSAEAPENIPFANLTDVPVKAPVVIATSAVEPLFGLGISNGWFSFELADGDRVLVTQQGAENGIYIAHAEAWERAEDANEPEDFPLGFLVLDREHKIIYSFYADTVPVEIGTTSLDFTPGQIPEELYELLDIIQLDGSSTTILPDNPATGNVNVHTEQGHIQLWADDGKVFIRGNSDYEAILDTTQLTEDRDISFPDEAGTLATQDYVDDRADTHFEQPFITSSSVTVTHNLGKYPAVTVIDSANDEVEGEVEHVSINELIVSFSAPFSGKVYCN